MDICLIAAVAENGVIGVDGEIPWHIPEDLQHFKETTLGSPVIMGRRTFESIVTGTGGPLTDRMNIVLSSSPEQVKQVVDEKSGLESLHDATSIYPATTSDEALALSVTEESDTVYVAGGASVYEEYFPLADKLLLTEVKQSYEGDTEFPDWDRESWTETSREDHGDFAFVEYERTPQ